jgi:rhodanese-related sulfurtransferase
VVPTASKPSLQSHFPAPPDGAPVEIDGAAAQELFRLGARFVDARRTADFLAGHVPGAKGLPVWEDGLEAKLQDLDAQTKDPNDPLVIYCSGGGCRDSHELAQKLWLMGFRNLRIYTGGWPEWHEKGWPAATGPEGAR